jgi:RNA polymerase sigma factor (sigma-70 family)
VSDEVAIERAISEVHRREWATVLASTARTLRDLDLAEECVQDAYAAALVAWKRDGVPNNPAAWLTTAAKRRATDLIRRETRLRPKLPLLMDAESTKEDEMDARDPSDEVARDAVPDDRLRLIFMCCHPALATDAQLALTLRLVCGMATADIAKALLVSEPTMGARLTRAKLKIAVAQIPLRVPRAAELTGRLQTVLNVIYLLFTAGHTAPSGSLVDPRRVGG